MGKVGITEDNNQASIKYGIYIESNWFLLQDVNIMLELEHTLRRKSRMSLNAWPVETWKSHLHTLFQSNLAFVQPFGLTHSGNSVCNNEHPLLLSENRLYMDCKVQVPAQSQFHHTVSLQAFHPWGFTTLPSLAEPGSWLSVHEKSGCDTKLSGTKGPSLGDLQSPC